MFGAGGAVDVGAAPFVEGDFVDTALPRGGEVGGAGDEGVEAFGGGGVAAVVEFEAFEGRCEVVDLGECGRGMLRGFIDPRSEVGNDDRGEGCDDEGDAEDFDYGGPEATGGAGLGWGNGRVVGHMGYTNERGKSSGRRGGFSKADYRVSREISSGVSGMPSLPGEERSKESGRFLPGER